MNKDLDYIFACQAEMIPHHVEKERKNNARWSCSTPVDLSTRAGQMQIKDFFWRVTEEVTETIDKFRHSASAEDIMEELVDVLHFLVEVAIHVGVTPYDLAPVNNDQKLQYLFDRRRVAMDSVDHSGYELIHELGQCAAMMKARPWRDKFPPVHKDDLIPHIRSAFMYLLSMFGLLVTNIEEIVEAFTHKYNINKRRLAEGY